MHLDDTQLLAALERCPNPGTLCKHYKGDVYEVTGRGINEDTLEPMVIFHRQGDRLPVPWIRPLSIWREMLEEKVEVDGEWVPRYVEVTA